jgi:hypothetical protein
MSCHYSPEISAETKQDEHGYSCSVATIFQCTTCQVVFAVYHPLGGTRWRSWLRHCATNRKVTGSILDGVIGIFY